MSLSSWVMLLTLSVLWGGSFILVEFALFAFSPFLIVLLRVGLAAMLLFLYILIKRTELPRSYKVWRDYAVMGLLNNAVPFSLIVWGQTQINGSLASILNATTPIFTVVIAHFLTSDERFQAHKAIGVAIGFVVFLC